MSTDELPHEVIISIQRVLDIQSTEDFDRLDGLSEKFDAIEILNDFFPDGTYIIIWLMFGYVLSCRPLDWHRGFARSSRCCERKTCRNTSRTAKGGRFASSRVKSQSRPGKDVGYSGNDFSMGLLDSAVSSVLKKVRTCLVK